MDHAHITYLFYIILTSPKGNDDLFFGLPRNGKLVVMNELLIK